MLIHNQQQMTVGGGCFWCIEAIFNQIHGVENVVSGYSGGTVPGVPTYREVCSGLTGHTEVVQITFDPHLITYKELLVIFMTSHDPTTSRQQGSDFGSQYRSVIFYHDETQKDIAEAVLKDSIPFFDKIITTEISPLTTFFEAEAYHQKYYAKNPEGGFCTTIISPKLEKLKKLYPSNLKPILDVHCIKNNKL